MGGSRCTYRNCTMKSDGAIHMFHYPVYDKTRCHEWLVNAHRFDFLNLKLSQLRNRVVCQHHFRDECFMNYKKEKLVFAAIPTEDGPGCKNNTNKDNVVPSNKLAETFALVFSENDFENDKFMKRISKPNPSITYADFLTNGDVWEKQSLNETIWNNMVITDEKKQKAEGKAKTKWQSIDEPDAKLECRNSLITLQNPLNVDTKISRLEEPLIVNVNLQATEERLWTQTEPILVQNQVIKSYQKPKTCQQSKSIQNNVKKELNSFLLNQEHTYSNQEVKCIIPDFVNQENNTIIANFNNFEGSNITLQPNIDILDDKSSQIEQQLHFITSTGDICAIIENPNEQPIEIKLNDTERKREVSNFISIDQWKEKQTCKKVSDLNTRKPKVQILSQKTISDPVVVKGQLQHVSPSSFIHILKSTETESGEIKHETDVIDVAMDTNSTKDLQLIDVAMDTNSTKDLQLIDVAMDTNSTKDLQLIKDIIQGKDDIKPNNTTVKNLKRNKSNEVSNKQSLLKPKITPERVAAIEKKRNFNKKLRDIIEVCLDKLYDQDKINDDVKANDSPIITDPKENQSKSLTRIVSSYLAKDTDLPSTHEYTMKFLEERMKKMENTLLNKIEQNSQRIIELKRTVAKAPQVNKTVHTQTASSEEAHKKHLYNEISKFLSPEANSLLYEELFINIYAPKLSHQSSSSKRRKRR